MEPEKVYRPSVSSVNRAAGYFLPDGRFEKSSGLSWFIAGFFVVGTLAGGGIVALPSGMVQYGFGVGMFFTVLVCSIVCYSGCVLGECWVILQRRWPSEYCEDHIRKPYAEIAYRAWGEGMRSVMAVIVNVNQGGVAIVYLLLSAKNIHDLLRTFFNMNITFCVIILILAASLAPVLFLKSPQDFWGAAVLSTCTSSIAVTLIVIGASLDYGECAVEHSVPPFGISNFFLATGTFIFSYGGHAVFPTIQHDMRRPSDFKKSVFMGFMLLALMYVPVSVVGYWTYGDSIRDSIINSIQTTWIQQTVNLLITVHCLFTVIIVISPINQASEVLFNVPQYFCAKRVLVRSGTLLTMVFVAETLPTFGPLLDLVGGLCLATTSLILPCFYYLLLSTGERMENERTALYGKQKAKAKMVEWPTLSDIREKSDRVPLFLCTFVILFGLLGGGAATFSAIMKMSVTHFIPPCYIAPFLENVALDPSSTGKTNCCGHYQNISRHVNEPQFCSPPDLGFY